jgi:hypothetical protein
MTKRGRPPGATSRWRNPNNYAAHHAQGLIELWLAGAPVLEIRVMLLSLAGSPEHQGLIEECWSQRGNERRYTVPPKIKRKLCRLAVAHVVELHCDAIRRRRARAAKTALRIQGWTDTQIAEILRRRRRHSGSRAGPTRRSPKSSAEVRQSLLIWSRWTSKKY